MPLTAMNDSPEGLENLKLLYGIGALTPAGKAMAATATGTSATAGTAPRSSTMPEQVSAFGQMFKSVAEGAATLLKPTPKPDKPAPGPTPGPRPGTPWTTYALIGGGVLLVGALVFAVVKKRGK